MDNSEKNMNYGLKTSDELFLYCYYMDNSELVVKNRNDFDKQFETTEYKELQRSINESNQYIQPEVIHLPVIQLVKPGHKYVFVFESKEILSDYIIVKRIAFECEELKDELAFPSDVKGYFMKDGADWPPDIHVIEKGKIRISNKSSIEGCLVGNLDLLLENEEKISGRFIIYNKNKSLFFCLPARINGV